MRKTCKITVLETSKICQLTVLVLRILPYQPCTTLHSFCVNLRSLREKIITLITKRQLTTVNGQQPLAACFHLSSRDARLVRTLVIDTPHPATRMVPLPDVR